ncbi:GIY-YIG nuclease family protein [Moheibacter lacus]|uniref:GIY-YIG nuclease family protein n=1 Tax=Moheibacter lacus TaxID=2745851 RepID=A0A838ZGY1_9FLAO|nr:GIY-YIG nuclease family protein [Moheibacter lacus]MBA5628941.1 GIY-YIG nuclease family protein [Moheibacter lacus]
MKTYYVYILKCKDGTYYTGMTNNLERRLNEHNSGLNKECYTFNRRPVELVFHESFMDVNQAIFFEKKIKKWSKAKKEAIINGNWNELKTLSECQNNSHSKNFNQDNE